MEGMQKGEQRELTPGEQRLHAYVRDTYPAGAKFTYRSMARDDSGRRRWKYTTLTIDEAFQACKAMMSGGEALAHEKLAEMYQLTLERQAQAAAELSKRALG